VVECCTISVDDDLEGSKLILFVVAKKIISNKINNIINSHFGSFALPRAIYYIKELPKTRSGKILRRLIREILINPNKKLYGDTSTMLNPRLIIEIKKVLLN
jgi:acetyl-CoA synthetase